MPQKNCSVYVVELANTIGPRKRPAFPNLYVGQTAEEPEQRLTNHLQGHRASRHVNFANVFLVGDGGEHPRSRTPPEGETRAPAARHMMRKRRRCGAPSARLADSQSYASEVLNERPLRRTQDRRLQ
jgi:hypothetical protein